jgi:hypothetical protein
LFFVFVSFLSSPLSLFVLSDPLKMASSIFSNCPLFHPPCLHSLSWYL